MPEKDLLDNLNVTSPCSADWESMIGNDQVRFCSHCNLSVHNLSNLSRKHALKLIARPNGRLCVRYMMLPDGAIKTRSGPPSSNRIGRHASRIAAGAFSATLTVSGGAAARVPFDRSLPSSGAVSSAYAPVRLAAAVSKGGASIRGFIFDPSGAVIPGAVVSLKSAENGLHVTSTNGDGEYRLDELDAGLYVLKVEATGFTTSEVTGIDLASDRESRIDQTLSVASAPEGQESQRFRITQGMVAVSLPTEPLVRAAQSDDIDAVKELLVGRPNPNVRDRVTETTALEQAVLNANREIMQLLLLAGVDVNLRDRDGRTPIMMLVEQTTPEAVWDLIHAGAKVNARDNDGDTALIEAAVYNNLEVLKALLDAGSRVDAKNDGGQTALMRAAEEGLVNNVRTLIRAGADLNARDAEGKTAWIYAFESDRRSVLRLLRSYGADETPAPKKN